MKGNIKNLFFLNFANAITASRLIFSIWLVAIAVSESDGLALIMLLVILCIISDVLDGWVARRFKTATEAGAFLDRIADKIFVCPSILILVWRYWPPNHLSLTVKFLTEGLVSVVILLELILVLLGLYGLSKGYGVNSNKWGKRKMVFQSIAICLWFLALNLDYYLKTSVLEISIFVIDVFLVSAIMSAVKSIEGYWQIYYVKH